MQSLFLIEPALHLQTRQKHTIASCSHLLSTWDHCLELRNGLYVLTLSQLQCAVLNCQDFGILPHGLILQVDIFTEEIIRSGSASSLSALLNRLDPVLRTTANLGRFEFSTISYLNFLEKKG